MEGLKIIITGATGMVGEGVLFECLKNERVREVLMVNRKPYDHHHPKLKELILADFLQPGIMGDRVKGYDACFFCAGVSSIGMKEADYTRITYDTTLSFAKAVLAHNPGSSFCYVSGSATDSTERGRLMWARVKGKTENDLAKLPFRSVFNFRPGVMVPFPGQKNWKKSYKLIAQLIKLISPRSVLPVQDVGRAMINAVTLGYPKPVLEVRDIRELAAK